MKIVSGFVSSELKSSLVPSSHPHIAPCLASCFSFWETTGNESVAKVAIRKKFRDLSYVKAFYIKPSKWFSQFFTELNTHRVLLSLNVLKMIDRSWQTLKRLHYVANNVYVDMYDPSLTSTEHWTYFPTMYWFVVRFVCSMVCRRRWAAVVGLSSCVVIVCWLCISLPLTLKLQVLPRSWLKGRRLRNLTWGQLETFCLGPCLRVTMVIFWW